MTATQLPMIVFAFIGWTFLSATQVGTRGGADDLPDQLSLPLGATKNCEADVPVTSNLNRSIPMYWSTLP